MTVIQVELGLDAQRGFTESGDVHLEPGQTLHVGDVVRLRDEGGLLLRATVAEVTRARYGQRYRLRLEP